MSLLSSSKRLAIVTKSGNNKVIDPADSMVGAFVCKHWVMMNGHVFAAIGSYEDQEPNLYVALQPVKEFTWPVQRVRATDLAHALTLCENFADALIIWATHLTKKAFASQIKPSVPRVQASTQQRFVLIPEIRLNMSLEALGEAAGIWIMVDGESEFNVSYGRCKSDISKELLTMPNAPSELKFFSSESIKLHPEEPLPEGYGLGRVRRNAYHLVNGKPTLSSSVHSTGIPTRALVAFASIIFNLVHGLSLGQMGQHFLSWANREVNIFISQFFRDTRDGYMETTLTNLDLTVKWTSEDKSIWQMQLIVVGNEALWSYSGDLGLALRSCYNSRIVRRTSQGVNTMKIFTGPKKPL